MTTTSTGRQAEAAAADYLKANGFKILATNWRTRRCEIDIVAKQRKTVYFVEVKYRKTDTWGGGLDYIGPKKLAQMRFAAETWVSDNDWRGDYCLVAVEVSGTAFEVSNYLENV